MKIKKIMLLILIIIILIYIPSQSFAWLQYSIYEKSNIINESISWIMKIIAFIIGISYITLGIQYLKRSKDEKSQKIKNALTWLMVITIEIIFLISGAVWVKEIGMETYWTSGERFQFNQIDGYISNGIRGVGLVLLIAFILISAIYLKKSKQEKVLKIDKIVKWQVITSVVVAGLLILATRW